MKFRINENYMYLWGVWHVATRSENTHTIPFLFHFHIWINFMKVRMKSNMILTEIKSYL